MYKQLKHNLHNYTQLYNILEKNSAPFFFTKNKTIQHSTQLYKTLHTFTQHFTTIQQLTLFHILHKLKNITQLYTKLRDSTSIYTTLENYINQKPDPTTFDTTLQQLCKHKTQIQKYTQL